jgi:hypothetical protein
LNFTLDASASVDPDQIQGENETFIWSCFTTSGAFCRFENSFVMANIPVMTIPAFSLAVGEYNFTVLYIKGRRFSTSSVIITIQNDLSPIVLLSSVPSIINRDEKLVIQGNATIINGDPNIKLKYDWIVNTTRGIAIPLNSENLLSRLEQPTLVINPNMLTIGESYIFTLIATYSDVTRSVSGFATSGAIMVNRPPQPGTFVVTPTIGVTAQTQFTLLCSQWFDQDQPLLYSFSYLQGSQWVTLSVASQSNQVTLTLPAGNPFANYSLLLEARIVDRLGAATVIYRNVTVNPLPGKNSTQLVELAASKAASSLADALVNDDSQQVVQVLNTVVQLVNTPLVSSPLGPIVNNCPNQCSGHGSCIQRVCTCDVGWSTSDCSLSDQELRQRQQLRQQLLTSLVQSSNSSQQQDPLTQQDIVQQVAIVSQITSKPEELSSESKQLAVAFVSSLLTASTVQDDARGQNPIIVDDLTASTVASALSNIAEAVFSSPPNTNASSQVKELAASVSNTINQLGSVLLASKVPGEVPSQILQPGLSITAQKEFAAILNNLTVQVEQYDLDIYQGSIKLPSNILSQSRSSRNIRSIMKTAALDIAPFDIVSLHLTRSTR